MSDEYQPPTFKVDCDQWPIAGADGEPCHPYAGMWVRYRRSISLYAYEVDDTITQLRERGKAGDLPSDAEWIDALRQMHEVMADQIAEVRFTSVRGFSLPQPSDRKAFIALLKRLEPDERQHLWLSIWRAATVPNV